MKQTATEKLLIALSKHADGDNITIPATFFYEEFKKAKINELEQMAEARFFGYDMAIGILRQAGERLTDPLLQLLTLNETHKREQ
jgi:hypothetical protein